MFPVIILQAATDQHVPPVHVSKGKRVAKAIHVSSRPEDDGRLNALLCVQSTQLVDEGVSRARLPEVAAEAGLKTCAGLCNEVSVPLQMTAVAPACVSNESGRLIGTRPRRWPGG